MNISGQTLQQQYIAYIEKVIRLDFGPSYTYQTDSVNEVIACTFPISLQIGTLAFVIAVLVGIMVGMIAEVNKNKSWDYYFPMILAMVGICSPYVWLWVRS